MKRPDTFADVFNVTGADDIPVLSCADALQQRGNLVLFTPALLFTHGGFDRDPVIEFDARFPAAAHEQRPFCVDLRKDTEFFFEGFPVMPAPGSTVPVNWNQRVYAIDQQRAEDCFAFLGGISYSNSDIGFFGSAFSYALDIADPTSKKHDRLVVNIFGAMTNSFLAYLEPRSTNVPIVRCPKTVDGKLPKIFHGQTVFSGFTGEDQITMRDE